MGQQDAPLGYALYTVRDGVYGPTGEDRDADEGQRLTLRELVATTPAAYRALWQTLASHDLVRRIHYTNTPEDDPLFDLIQEPRLLRRATQDGIMARIVDLAAALPQRPYGAPLSLRLRVIDRDCEWNDGLWAFQTDGQHTTVERTPIERSRIEPTTDAPQLTLPIHSLASLLTGYRRRQPTRAHRPRPRHPRPRPHRHRPGLRHRPPPPLPPALLACLRPARPEQIPQRLAVDRAGRGTAARSYRQATSATPRPAPHATESPPIPPPHPPGGEDHTERGTPRAAPPPAPTPAHPAPAPSLSKPVLRPVEGDPPRPSDPPSPSTWRWGGGKGEGSADRQPTPTPQSPLPPHRGERITLRGAPREQPHPPPRPRTSCARPHPSSAFAKRPPPLEAPPLRPPGGEDPSGP